MNTTSLNVFNNYRDYPPPPPLSSAGGLRNLQQWLPNLFAPNGYPGSFQSKQNLHSNALQLTITMYSSVSGNTAVCCFYCLQSLGACWPSWVTEAHPFTFSPRWDGLLFPLQCLHHPHIGYEAAYVTLSCSGVCVTEAFPRGQGWAMATPSFNKLRWIISVAYTVDEWTTL